MAYILNSIYIYDCNGNIDIGLNILLKNNMINKSYQNEIT